MSGRKNALKEVSRGGQNPRIGIERVDVAPPSNLDAERSVLGVMLVAPEAAVYGAEHLVAEDFWRAAHGVLFAAMQQLVAQKVGVDYLTVNNCLSPSQLEAVGGLSYITGLTDGIPRSTNLPYYVDILHDHRLRREILGVSDQILGALTAHDLDGTALLAHLDQWVTTITQHRGGELIPQAKAVADTLADLDVRMANPGALTGVETGFASINEYTSGWQPGDFIIIAARPGVGKTAFALNTAVAAARAGKKVAIFSLEMTVKQLEYRMLSAISGVMLFKILKGYLTEMEQRRIGAAVAELHELPIFIDDTAMLTAPQIRAKCRQTQVRHGLDLVIVDYLQLVQGASVRRDTTRQEDVADISRRLKATGKDLNVPMLALSQLSRAPESRKDTRPRLTDLRESGALEQDADIVAFIHREDYKTSGAAEFLLDKARNGPTGVLELVFDREIVRFSGPVV